MTPVMSHVEQFGVKLRLLTHCHETNTRAIMQRIAKALRAEGLHLAPGAAWEVSWIDPNPKRRPHELATKRDEPCPRCGSRWVRPAIDTSDPLATECPTVSVCAYCHRRADAVESYP